MHSVLQLYIKQIMINIYKLKMNQQFFKIIYNSTMKLVPFCDNYDKFLSTIAASFSITPSFVRSLVCNYKDKENDTIAIYNQYDYDILIKYMKKNNLKTVKITLTKNETRCEVGTTSEFELLPSQDFTVQTDETQKNVEIQTERREEDAKGCQTRKEKGHKGSLEYELKQAKKDVKQMVRKELQPIKEKLFNEMYQKLEAQIKQKYNINTDIEKIQNCYNETSKQKTKNNHCKGKVCLLNTNDINQENKPIFTTIKGDHKRCGRRTVTCLNSTLNLYTKNNKTQLKTFLHLRNDGRVSWPNPCYLKCLEGVSEIKGETIKISNIILPGKDINIEVTFDLSTISKNGKYESTWQLQNEKREYFGDSFTFSIECLYENNLTIKSEFVETYKKKEEMKTQKKPTDYKALVREMRKEYDIYVIEDDNAIMNALILTGGNKVSAFNNLLSSRQNACYYGAYDALVKKKVSTTDELLKDYQIEDKEKTEHKKGIKYYDLFEEMKNEFDIGMLEEDNTIMNALIRNKGNKIKALNEMLDKRSECDSVICNEEDIKYIDLLEEMRKDFDVKNISNNEIINALIATKGNKANAFNKILEERE